MKHLCYNLLTFVLKTSSGDSKRLIFSNFSKRTWSTYLRKDMDVMEVKISSGVVKGKKGLTLHKKSNYYSFEGIPYAKPPIGDLRFHDPVPCGSWEGTYDATTFHKIPYQIMPTKEFEHMQDEDCLHLNVFTPSLPKEDLNPKYPVMFFIYGGAFLKGHAAPDKKGPEFFMDHDVVVVTFNYRVGPFGFLSTCDDVIKGNFGLKDQLLALKWTNKNILNFGGDPEKITVFGQSAGSVSVAHLLFNDEATGLYRAAILESGSPLNAWCLQKNARKYAYKTATYLDSNFKSTDSKELLTFLRQAKASDIMKAAIQVAQEQNELSQLLEGFVYSPVMDPKYPSYYEAISSGKVSNVPIIIGITSEEILRAVEDTNLFLKLVQYFDANPNKFVPVGMNITENEEKIVAGKKIREIYSKTPLHKNLAAAVKFFSDTAMNRGIIKHADLQSKNSEVYFYVFSYRGKMGANPVEIEGAEKVAHAEENQYLWTNLCNKDLSQFPKEDIAVQEILLKYWTNFAKHLKPSADLDKEESLTMWPSVRSQGDNKFVYLNIDSKPVVVNNFPKAEEYRAWNNIFNDYGKPPYNTY